jgi:hypothetical protein
MIEILQPLYKLMASRMLILLILLSVVAVVAVNTTVTAGGSEKASGSIAYTIGVIVVDLLPIIAILGMVLLTAL